MKEAIAKVSKERLEICSTCSFQSEMQKKVHGYKTMRPDVHCTHCGCTLSAKTACLSCNCPINLWGPVASSEQHEHLQKELNEPEQVKN